MLSEIGIHHLPGRLYGGPNTVAHYLLRGLAEIGVKVYENEVREHNGCLQSGANSYRSLPIKSLMGPNLFVVPSDDPAGCERYRNFVVPSQWVKDLYDSYGQTAGKKIEIWASGVDTESYPVMDRSSYDMHALIYQKARSSEELSLVTGALQNMDIGYTVISYGSYDKGSLP